MWDLREKSGFCVILFSRQSGNVIVEFEMSDQQQVSKATLFTLAQTWPWGSKMKDKKRRKKNKHENYENKQKKSVALKTHIFH